MLIYRLFRRICYTLQKQKQKQKNLVGRQTPFYIFANLFAVLEDNWISISALHSICCYVLFWLKHMKKMQPHTFI